MRLGPKLTLIASDLARAALVALIPVLHATGSLTLPLLLAIGFAVGGFFAPYSSASWLSMARLVDEDEGRLTRVAGFFGAAQEGAAFLGPALGGVLVVAWGAVQVLVVDAASFLVPAVVVAIVVPSSGRTAAKESRTTNTQEKGGLSDGLRWLAAHRSLARRVIGAAIQNTGWTAMMLALPVMALHRFHGDARLAGWFVAAYGAGSVAGGLAVTRMRNPSDRTAMTAIWGFAGATWLLPAAPWPWTVMAAVAGCGVANGVFYARFFATLTVRVPEEMNAKIMTTVTVALSATGPAGFVAAGQILQRTGSATACLAGIAVVSTVGAGVVATSYRSDAIAGE
jgi:MFS family permease